MAKQRDAKATRQRILWAAFREFQRIGYRGADLERVVQQSGVTKGALYYHFEGKRALGYAVIDEILQEWIVDRWLKPLDSRHDLLDSLVGLARWGERTVSPAGLSLGCPLNNLSQELSGADEGFRQRLQAVYERWREGLFGLLVEAQERGEIRADVDPTGAAAFIIASWEGSIGLAKCHQTSEILSWCRQGLEDYLETLRPPSQVGERGVE